jgi:hypothetical protein
VADRRCRTRRPTGRFGPNYLFGTAVSPGGRVGPDPVYASLQSTGDPTLPASADIPAVTPRHHRRCVQPPPRLTPTGAGCLHGAC